MRLLNSSFVLHFLSKCAIATFSSSSVHERSIFPCDFITCWCKLFCMLLLQIILGALSEVHSHALLIICVFGGVHYFLRATRLHEYAFRKAHSSHKA